MDLRGWENWVGGCFFSGRGKWGGLVFLNHEGRVGGGVVEARLALGCQGDFARGSIRMSKQFFDGIEWEAEVKYSGRPLDVVMSFATGEEMDRIGAWGDYADYGESRLSRDQKEILEYASLLGGMYRVYDANERFAASANRLERIIRENPREDVLFALIMRMSAAAAGKISAPFANDEILGFAAMRHTWKNTVKLEFLAVNPSHKGTGMEIRGVGGLLLAASVEISEMLSAPMFWAECTETSLGFYRKQKFATLEDIVFLDAAGIEGFLEAKNKEGAS